MTDQIFIMIFQWKNKFKPWTHHIMLFPSSFKSVWKCAVSQIYAWSFRFPLLSLLLLKMVSGLLLPRASVERGLQTYMVTSGSLQTSALGRWVWLAAWTEDQSGLNRPFGASCWLTPRSCGPYLPILFMNSSHTQTLTNPSFIPGNFLSLNLCVPALGHVGTLGYPLCQVQT